MTRVEIDIDERSLGSIRVDGVDISNSVSAFSVDSEARKAPVVRIQGLRVSIKADARVELDGHTRDVLATLGWTPPS